MLPVSTSTRRTHALVDSRAGGHGATGRAGRHARLTATLAGLLALAALLATASPSALAAGAPPRQAGPTAAPLSPGGCPDSTLGPGEAVAWAWPARPVVESCEPGAERDARTGLRLAYDEHAEYPLSLEAWSEARRSGARSVAAQYPGGELLVMRADGDLVAFDRPLLAGGRPVFRTGTSVPGASLRVIENPAGNLPGETVAVVAPDGTVLFDFLS